MPDNIPAYKDNDGNEITPAGKFLAAAAVILFTLCSALYLIGHWPDRLPKPGDEGPVFYSYKWFDVRLLSDTCHCAAREEEPAGKPADDAAQQDTVPPPEDTAKAATPAAVQAAVGSMPRPPANGAGGGAAQGPRIHINTLLLILVAVAGFLGNMIHVATSFTTYIGAGQFKKSWALWYCIKPFTAAALAVAIYFVFRGGFLNMSDDSANINLYGVMTISLLAGLFTDRTTLKLKEVFEVLMRPKEDRPDALEDDTPKVTEIKADPLEAGKPVVITLSGKQLDKQKLDISIEGQTITGFDVKPDSVTFSYTLPDELKDKPTLTLVVKAAKAKDPQTYTLNVKPAAAGSEPADSALNPGDIVPDGPDDEDPDHPLIKE